jgi:hypothetical protein
MRHTGMGLVGGAEDLLGHRLLVAPKGALDLESADLYAFEAQGDLGAGGDGLPKGAGEIQEDRQRKELPIGEPHPIHDAGELCLGHEPREGGESSEGELLQLEILASIDVDPLGCH